MWHRILYYMDTTCSQWTAASIFMEKNKHRQATVTLQIMVHEIIPVTWFLCLKSKKPDFLFCYNSLVRVLRHSLPTQQFLTQIAAHFCLSVDNQCINESTNPLHVQVLPWNSLVCSIREAITCQISRKWYYATFGWRFCLFPYFLLYDFWCGDLKSRSLQPQLSQVWIQEII